MEINRSIETTPLLSGKLRILSLLAIGCVVLQHASYGVSTENATGLLYRDLVSLGFADFPVPYFFIVSGFFFMKKYSPTFKWYGGELSKRLKTLALPYFIFCTLGILVYRSFSYEALLKDYGITDLLPVVGSLWYVRTLFVLCVCSPLMIAVAELLARHRTVRLCALFLLPFLLIPRLPCQSSVIAPVVYFTFGIFLSRFGACLVTVPLRRKLLGAMALLAILLPLKLAHSFAAPSAEPILRKAMIPGTLALVWFGYDWFYAHFPRLERGLSLIPDFIVRATFFIYCSESFIRLFLDKVLLVPCGCTGILRTPLGAVAWATLAIAFSLLLAGCLGKFAPQAYAVLSGGRGGRKRSEASGVARRILQPDRMGDRPMNAATLPRVKRRRRQTLI